MFFIYHILYMFFIIYFNLIPFYFEIFKINFNKRYKINKK